MSSRIVPLCVAALVVTDCVAAHASQVFNLAFTSGPNGVVQFLHQDTTDTTPRRGR